MDARRRAERLVRVDSGVREPGFPCDFLKVGKVRVTHWLSSLDAAELCEDVRAEVEAALSDAVSASEELSACALRDMAVDSQAFAEGWMQGAEATLGVICRRLYDSTEQGRHLALQLEAASVPEPPSHDGGGAPLKPHRVRLERDVYRAALVEICKVISARYAPSGAERAVEKLAARALQEVKL